MISPPIFGPNDGSHRTPAGCPYIILPSPAHVAGDIELCVGGAQAVWCTGVKAYSGADDNGVQQHNNIEALCG